MTFSIFVSINNIKIDHVTNICFLIDDFSVEKDHHDNVAKTRESQDCSTKVLELQKKLDQARAQVKNITIY